MTKLLFLATAGAIYLLPAIVAGCRNHASVWGILALNLLLGWTGVIWILSLVWALSNKGTPGSQTVVVHNHGSEGQPPAPVQPIYIPVPQAAAQVPLPSSEASLPLIEHDTKACPACAETIKAAAVKCRFCGERLNRITIIEGPSAAHGE